MREYTYLPELFLNSDIISISHDLEYVPDSKFETVHNVQDCAMVQKLLPLFNNSNVII